MSYPLSHGRSWNTGSLNRRDHLVIPRSHIHCTKFEACVLPRIARMGFRDQASSGGNSFKQQQTINTERFVFASVAVRAGDQLP